MSLRLYTIVIDSHDIASLARWWATALDWQIVFEDSDEVAVVPVDLPDWVDLDAPVPPSKWQHLPPALVFVPVDDVKTTKNRLHIDLAPHLTDDRDAEIRRLIDLGARRVDVGQGDDVTWTVLADPEGNEFCVLSARDN